jgi:hypothetical protein
MASDYLNHYKVIARMIAALRGRPEIARSRACHRRSGRRPFTAKTRLLNLRREADLAIMVVQDLDRGDL